MVKFLWNLLTKEVIVLKTGFIGHGRVATAFSGLLERNNVTVCGFHTRTDPNPKALEDCDIIFVAVPDDAIASAAKEIKTNAKIFCHFSGALPSDILYRKELTVASLHPAMTFTENTDLSDVVYAFEGRGEKIGEFKKFLKELNLDFFEIETDKKPLYHASMCNVSNHITTLVDMTKEMLLSMGIPEDKAIKAITPLAVASLKNALENNPGDVLTGPVSRGDINTVRLHMPYVNGTYRKMAEETAFLALKAGRIDKKTADEIINVLREGEKNGINDK